MAKLPEAKLWLCNLLPDKSREVSLLPPEFRGTSCRPCLLQSACSPMHLRKEVVELFKTKAAKKNRKQEEKFCIKLTD